MKHAAMSDRPSGYHRDGRTIAQVGREWLDRLLASVENDEVSREDHYGMSEHRAEEYTLAGGGPGADIVFLFDSDGIRCAYYSYYEWDGKVCFMLEHWQAVRVYDALQESPRPEGDDDA